MTRIERLRIAKNWSQPAMATYLGCSQATVSRLENGQRESGAVSRLLDRLEQDIAAGRIVPEPSVSIPAEVGA